MEDVFLREQLKIARKTTKLSRAGALILGGMDHDTARVLLATHCNESANLDAMEELELLLVATDETAHSGIARYAGVKAQAIAKRFAGDVAGALELERNCETIYKALPAPLKW